MDTLKVDSHQGSYSRVIGHLEVHVTDLIRQYQHPPVHVKPLPRPVAYEFQHAMAHVTYALMHCDKEGKIRQYRSAFEHLRRGLLDAWKVHTFKDSHLKTILKDNNKTSTLLKARLREYTETSAVSNPPASLGALPAIDWYRKLHTSSSTHCSPSTTNSCDCGKKFFELYHHWAQYELLLSAFMGTKDLTILESMLSAALNGFSVPQMETCLEQLQGILVFEILRKTPSSKLTIWLKTSPQRQERYEKAYKAKSNPRNSALRNFLPDLLDYYGIRESIYPFTPINSKQ